MTAMKTKRVGKQSAVLPSKPVILAGGSVAGLDEAKGPLGKYFDYLLEEDLFGEDSWEKCERKMFAEAVEIAINKAGKTKQDIDVLMGGDLLNQIISASFAARALGIPFLGQYGACSTMSQSMVVAAMLIDGGFSKYAACAASSHFATAERQYRLPVEMGTQKPVQAQHTVTGAGCAIMAAEGAGPKVTAITIGKVEDWGITDSNNMGAAMAPAAAETIRAHLTDLQLQPDHYDLIVTGDLGKLGRKLCLELLDEMNINVQGRFYDCGCEVLDSESDKHSGASGCGCSAIVFNGYLLPKLQRGEIKRMLFLATGALLSQTSVMQQDSVPSIAHAVAIEGQVN